jgi:hypothetical protein
MTIVEIPHFANQQDHNQALDLGHCGSRTIPHNYKRLLQGR